jgi:hypothetical protein
MLGVEVLWIADFFFFFFFGGGGTGIATLLLQPHLQSILLWLF